MDSFSVWLLITSLWLIFAPTIGDDFVIASFAGLTLVLLFG